MYSDWGRQVSHAWPGLGNYTNAHQRRPIFFLVTGLPPWTNRLLRFSNKASCVTRDWAGREMHVWSLRRVNTMPIATALLSRAGLFSPWNNYKTPLRNKQLCYPGIEAQVRPVAWAPAQESKHHCLHAWTVSRCQPSLPESSLLRTK